MSWQPSGPAIAVDGSANGGHPAPPSGQSGISVVTTIWDMTPGTQMPASQHTGGFSDGMYARGAPMRPQTPAYTQQPSQQQPGYCRQNSLPSAVG